LPAVITENTEGANDKERRILLNFQDEIEIGDIVVVRASKTGVDGVGVVVGEAEFDSTNKQFPRKRRVEWLHKGSEINISDLNGGKNLDRKSIYPLIRINAGDLLARIPGIADVEIKTETRPYVFIIDEINRGNISKIFGELITLIEDTKRSGSIECVPAVLPYSQKPFSVPENVYILGTMNTADRSIALIDTALRRRFHFVEMMPDSDVLKELNSDSSEIEIDGAKLDIVKLLETINNRIALLYDREHTIGHVFFTPLVKTQTIDTLRSIFEKKVIPLLQEYFYDDYCKIQLVLADNAKSSDDFKFIRDSKVKIRDVFKGKADEILNVENEMVEYTIQTEAFSRIQSYVEIYN
jgi:5-methylcytosine-specific restriction protein B